MIEDEIGVEFGVIKDLTVPKGLGLRAVVTNVVVREHGVEAVDDAALLLMRRSFGVGRTHIILRSQYHAILDVNEMIPVATEVAISLFGSADKDNVFKIADTLLDLADDVVMHPPEDQMKLWKQQQQMVEQSGALIRVNDTTILDAR